jgi:hypothetical protein
LAFAFALAAAATAAVLYSASSATAQETCQERKFSAGNAAAGTYLESGYKHQAPNSYYFLIRLESGQEKEFGAISYELADSWDAPRGTRVEFTWADMERAGYDTDACMRLDVIETIRKAP